MNMLSSVSSTLGFGVGLRPAHFSDFLSTSKTDLGIDWLEIISENYMKTGGYARFALEKLRCDYPVAAHGVGLSIAGQDPIDENYLRALSSLVAWLEPSLITDHLCWTSWKGKHVYDLLPFPLSQQSLNHVASRVDYVQEILGRSILLENPSAYIAFKGSDMTEPDFLRELSQKTGCGILLDLNNCIVNSRNLGWNPIDYLETLTPESVRQFHLAGHHHGEDISIDTHDEKVPDLVWDLYRIASQKFPHAAVLLEWDDKIPPLAVMQEELIKARKIDKESNGVKPNQRPQLAPKFADPSDSVNMPISGYRTSSFQIDQSKLFNDICTHELSSESELIDSPSGAQRGLRVYLNAYRARIREVLQATFPTLYFILEDDLFGDLCLAYLNWHTTCHYSIDYIGEKLSVFLKQNDLDMDFGASKSLVAAIAELEWEYYALHIKETDTEMDILRVDDLKSWSPSQWENAFLTLHKSETKLLVTDWPVFEIWMEAKEEKLSEPPARKKQLIFLQRVHHDVHVEIIPNDMADFWLAIQNGAQLEKLVGSLPSRQPAEALQFCIEQLISLSERQLLVDGSGP